MRICIRAHAHVLERASVRACVCLYVCMYSCVYARARARVTYRWRVASVAPASAPICSASAARLLASSAASFPANMRTPVSSLRCVAVCCSVLQCVAVCCSVLQCVAVCCSVLQRVTVCYSVLQCVTVYCNVLQFIAAWCSVLQCVAVCCIVCRRLLSLSRTIASFRYVGAIRSPPPFWFSLPHANDDMPMMIWQCASPRHGSRIQETACQCKALSSSPILTLGRHVPHDNDSCRRVCVRVEHTLQHTATH